MPDGPARVIADPTTGNVAKVAGERLHVTMSQVPSDLSLIVTDKLRDAGSSEDMAIDGSGAAVDFTFDADPTDDLFVVDIRFVFVPNVFRVDGGSFGAYGGLTNGVEFSVTSNGVKTVLALLKKSEDWFVIPGAHDTMLETQLDANDLLTLDVHLEGTLKLFGGTGDNVAVKIQDDLTSQGPNHLRTFEASVWARKMV